MDKLAILLNGPSSSGKSTLSRELRDVILEKTGMLYGIVSIDDHMKLSTDEVIYEDDVYDISRDICDSAVEALKTGSGVIIDHVITSERIYRQLEEAMLGFELFTVRVTCPLDVLKRRERERGDRHPGSAEASYMNMYPTGGYDATVDSGEMSARECALAVSGAINRKNESKK